MKRFLKWVFTLGLALAGQARAAEGGAPGHYTGTAVDDQGRPVAGASWNVIGILRQWRFTRRRTLRSRSAARPTAKAALRFPPAGA